MDQIVEFIKAYPWFADLVMVMGAFRVMFKPIFTLIDMIVVKTETSKDNLIWDKIKASKTMSFLVWVIDYLASVKIETLKKAQDIPLNLKKTS